MNESESVKNDEQLKREHAENSEQLKFAEQPECAERLKEVEPPIVGARPMHIPPEQVEPPQHNKLVNWIVQPKLEKQPAVSDPSKHKKPLVIAVAMLAAIFAVQGMVRLVNPNFFKELDDKFLEQRAELNYDSIAHELHKNGEIDQTIGRDNPKQSLADLDALLEDHPYNVSYLNSKGRILHAQKRTDEAIACFSRAIHIRPNEACLFGNRGFAFMDAEKYDEALADYNRALELEPDLGYVYNNRGALWLCKGQNRKAVDDLTQAIIRDPKDERAYTNRAFAHNNLEEYDKAIEDHNHVVALAPYSAIALSNRAWSYMRLNRNDMAVKDCDKALSFGQKVPGVFLICAEAYMANRDFQKAINCCNDLLKIDPHSQFASDTRKKAEQMLSAR